MEYTQAFAGIQTIRLEKPVKIPPGTLYSVVLQIPNGSQRYYLEKTSSSSSWFTTVAGIDANQSFYSADGKRWTDAAKSEYCFSIKAHTRTLSTSTVVTPDPDPDETPIVSPAVTPAVSPEITPEIEIPDDTPDTPEPTPTMTPTPTPVSHRINYNKNSSLGVGICLLHLPHRKNRLLQLEMHHIVKPDFLPDGITAPMDGKELQSGAENTIKPESHTLCPVEFHLCFICKADLPGCRKTGSYLLWNNKQKDHQGQHSFNNPL